MPFLNNMPERFAWADIIVCRAGAITAAEVAAAGRAAIFIPFGAGYRQPSIAQCAGNGKNGAGRVITESELTGERLSAEIFALLDNPAEIERMGNAARGLSRPNATRDIVDLIEQAAGVMSVKEKSQAAGTSAAKHSADSKEISQEVTR